MGVLLITQPLRLVERLGPEKQVNNTSWVAVVTPNDHPKSVCSRCVIEVFCGGLVLALYFFELSVGKGAFVTGLCQISSFFSYYTTAEDISFRAPGRAKFGTCICSSR